MPKKSTAIKKTSTKVEKENKMDRKLFAKRSKEIAEWKVKNSVQKWFFSLEENEQKLLENTYVVVMQMCPDLTWEDYLKRLRIIDKCNTTTKSVIKKAWGLLHL